MKKKILIGSMILINLTLFHSAFSMESRQINQSNITQPVQDTLRAYLTSLNLDSLTGKAVDSMLAKIPNNYTSIQILPGDQMKKAHFLAIKYSNGLTIGIFVKNFQYMNSNPPSSNWNLTLFKKEAINRIEIFDGVTCINGCY